jgi:hypothetical protein
MEKVFIVIAHSKNGFCSDCDDTDIISVCSTWEKAEEDVAWVNKQASFWNPEILVYNVRHKEESSHGRPSDSID